MNLSVLRIVPLLQMSYSSGSNIEDISDDCIAEFVEDQNFKRFSELFPKIENTEVKNRGSENRRDVKLAKFIAFVCFQVMDFPPKDLR